MSDDIFITGAGGLLGWEFATRFAAPHAAFGTGRVVALARRPLPAHDGLPGLEPRLDEDLFSAGWAADMPSDATVIHCAGLSNPRTEFSGLAEVLEQHVLPHLRMVETLVDRGWRGRLVLPSSGGAIYGDPRTLPVTEDHPLAPKSLYGLQKLYLEQGLGDLARRHGFDLAALRISNPYGSARIKPGQGVIPILVDAFLDGRTFQVFGDGTALRDYVHFDDLFAAVAAVTRAPIPGRVLTLNLGSGRGTSLNELIERLGRLLDRRLSCDYTPSPYDVTSNVLCCDRARAHLDWTPRVSLEDGLTRTLEALNARPR